MKVHIFLALLLCFGIAEKSYGASTSTTSEEPSTFPTADISSLGRSSGSAQSAHSSALHAINNAQSHSQATSSRSNSIFSRLPSSAELD